MPISNNQQKQPLRFKSVNRKKTLVLLTKFVNRRTTLIVLAMQIKCKAIRQKPRQERILLFLSLLLVLLALSVTMHQPEERISDWIFAFLPAAIDRLKK